MNCIKILSFVIGFIIGSFLFDITKVIIRKVRGKKYNKEQEQRLKERYHD